MNIQIVGYIATVLTALAILPNLYSAVIKKATVGFKYEYMVLGSLAKILWIIFALSTKNIPLIITSFYMLVCYIIIIFFKFYYEKNKMNLLATESKS